MKEFEICEYKSQDEQRFKEFFQKIENKKRTSRVMYALGKQNNAKKIWLAGIVALISNLKKNPSLGLFCFLSALWTVGLFSVCFALTTQEYNKELSGLTEKMANELRQVSHNEKSNAWLMTMNNQIVGTVALKYEHDEGKIGYLTGVDSKIRLQLLQHAFRFGKENNIQVISKWKHDTHDAKWSSTPL